MARVRLSPGFNAEVGRELGHLVAADEPEWIDRIGEDLAGLRDLLARFPEAGRELHRRGSTSLRKLKLKRSPFVIWYVVHPGAGDRQVTLLRLFHSRQRTPRPRLP